MTDRQNQPATEDRRQYRLPNRQSPEQKLGCQSKKNVNEDQNGHFSLNTTA
jgi:hypothetical protein